MALECGIIGSSQIFLVVKVSMRGDYGYGRSPGINGG